MNADAILDLLGPWVARRPAWRCMGRFRRASQPQGPHVVLNVTAADIVGGQPVDVCYELVPDATEEPALEISINLWEWTVSVDVYATDAMKRAALVKTWASSAAGLLDLLPLTVSGTSSVRLMPETAEGQWDGRAQLDITLPGVCP